jgi:phosphatidate cytidylyltransferase
VTRVLAALVLIAVVITTIWMLPPWATIGLAVLAAALAAFELAGLATGVRAGTSGVFGFGLAASAALFCVAFAVLPPDGIPDTVFVGLMLAMVVVGAVLLAMGPPTRATTTWAIALMAGVYVGLPLGALGKVQMVHGPAVLTVLLALVAVSDSAQYYAGRAFGRRKLAPSVSPAKTVEGALGGLVAAG